MNALNKPDTLIIGIGNIGRKDDGLGWAFLQQLEEEGKFAGELQYRYQLVLEDAEVISHYRQVIFVDASKRVATDGFYWERCEAKNSGHYHYSSHALEPAAIVALCRDLYNCEPAAYLLGITGSSWGLQQGMSRQAKRNLAAAYRFFADLIKKQAEPFALERG